MRSLRDDSFENFQIGGRLFALVVRGHLAMIAYPQGGSDTRALVRRIKFR